MLPIIAINIMAMNVLFAVIVFPSNDFIPIYKLLPPIPYNPTDTLELTIPDIPTDTLVINSANTIDGIIDIITTNIATSINFFRLCIPFSVNISSPFISPYSTYLDHHTSYPLEV